MKTIQYFIFFCIIMMTTFPLTKWIPFTDQLTTLFLILWLVIHFSIYGMLKRHRIYYGICGAYLLYIFSISFFSGNMVLFNRYLNLFTMFYFYIVFLESRSEKLYDNKKIVYFSFYTLLCTLIITLFNVFKNPYIIRSIKSSGEYSLEIQRNGIGGYSFMYLIVFLNIILMYIFLNKDSNKKINNLIKYLLTVFSILSISLILSANYLTAIFMTFTSIIILMPKFLIKIKYKNWLKLSVLMMILISFFWKVIMLNILNFLYLTINNLNTKLRIYEIINSVENTAINSNSGGADERINTWTESIRSFVDNPLFGISIEKIKVNNSGYLDGFGQHSFVLDTFSLFGLIIGLINIYLITYPFFIMYKGSLNTLKPLIVVLCITALYFFTINNATSSIGFVLYFLLPWICFKYELNRKKKGVEINNV